MTDEAKKAATALFNRVNRENKSAVATVGVKQSVSGGEVLIVYRNSGVHTVIPNEFEGFVVLEHEASALKQVP